MRHFWRFVTTGVLLLSVVFHFLPAIASAEAIPRSDQTSLEIEFKLARYKWRSAEVTLYAKHTTDLAELREASQRFLEGFYARYFWQPDAPDWSELMKRSGELVKAKSADPFVQQAIGIVLRNSGKEQQAQGYLEKSQIALASSAYPARCRWEGALQLIELHTGPTYTNDRLNAITIATTALLDLLANSKLPADSQRVLYAEVERFRQSFNDFELHKKFYDETLKQQDLDPWLKHMILGTSLYEHSYEIRGGDYWNELTPEVQTQFTTMMEQTAAEFTAAYELHSEFPEAAGEMIDVARSGGGKGTPREWFDRCVQAQMDYMPAYSSLLLSLLPRWGGSDEEMRAFGLECLASDEFETDVPYIFVQALHSIDEDHEFNGIVWREGDNYQRAALCLRRLCEDPLRADPLRERLGVTWLRSWHAHLAIVAHEEADARKLFEELGDDVVANVFNRDGTSLDYVRSRIYARTGEARSIVLKLGDLNFDKDRRNPELKVEAVALLKQARRQDREPRAQFYYDYWQNLYDHEQRFDDGEWVELPFDPQWKSWRKALAGEWSFGEDGSISATKGGNSTMLLQPTGQFPAPFIFECDVVSSEKKPNPSMPAGVVLGKIVSLGTPAFDTLLFFSDAAGQLAGTCGWNDQPYIGARQLGVTNRLRVKAMEGYYEFYINDQIVVEKAEPTFKPGHYIWLSPMWWYSTGTEVSFNRPRIRKWTAGPPPAFDDYDERLKYYAAEMKANEQDARAIQLYAMALYSKKEYFQALEHFERAIALQPKLKGVQLFAMSSAFLVHDYRAAQEFYQQMPSDKIAPEAKLYLAMILASAPENDLRDGQVALQVAEQLNKESDHKHADHLIALAAAHAELGQFDEALVWAQLADAAEIEGTKDELLAQLKLYEEKKPYRLKSPEEKVLARTTRKLTGKKLVLEVGEHSPARIKPVEPALIAHWKFDETKGAEVADSAGKHAGTIKGNSSWKPGQKDGAIYLDGQSHVDLGQVMDLAANDSFTIAAWVRADNADRATIISRMDEARDYRGFDVSLVGGIVYVNLVNRYPVNAIQVHTSNGFATQEWHHLLVTYDGSSKAAGVKIYFDGVAQTVVVPYDLLTETIATDQPWHLGLRSVNMPFKGLLDDVRVYNYVLTAEEIKTLAK